MLLSIKKRLRAFVADNQFSPSFLGVFVNPFWLCRRALNASLTTLAPRLSGTVLDFGCGSAPYKTLLVNSTSYVGLEYDTPENRAHKRAELFYDGVNIPLEDAAVDGLLATQSLEHIPNPEHIVAEWGRIIRPEGYLLLTVPFMWPEHEMPYDFYRYTSNGLRNILEQQGFEVVEQSKLLCDCRAPAQLFLAWLYDSLKLGHRSALVQLLLCAGLFAPVALFATAMAAIFPKNANTYLDNIILAKRK